MSKSTTCPACGASSTGNFCSSCGAALGGRHCTQCGSGLESGARFCNECGAPVGAAVPAGASAPAGSAAPTAGKKGSAPRAASGRGARTPAAANRSGGGGAQGTGEGSGGGSMGWWAAGAMMVLLLMILALPILRPEEPAPPVGAGGGVAPATTDISSMSPGEAASRLYNRVMQAASNNDTAQVQMFLPMAIDAHELAKPLSADEAFHLSSLQRMALRNEAALASAQEALELEPNHLLLLYTAGEAARAAGQTDLANRLANRLLEVWDAEMALGREEYGMHQGMMQDIRAFAESGGGG